MFFSKFQKLIKPDVIITKIIVNKFSNWGVKLSNAQKSYLKAQLKKDPINNFTIELTDAQEEQIRIAGFDPKKLSLDFNDFDKDGFEQKLTGILTDSIIKLSQELSGKMVLDWKKQSSETLKSQRNFNLEINNEINKRWGEPLGLLEMLLSICRQLGSDFNHYFLSNAAAEDDLVFEVLTRSHGRACQVGYEILTLLSNGFADGAHARWRTLHEITVVSAFIAQNGRELAQRYLDHTVITDYYEAKAYQKNCESLGLMPLSGEEIENLMANRDNAIKQYGPEFDEPYGWASIVVEKKHRNFAGIEEKVDLDHIRLFYKTANINIHAGSKGILFRLGSQKNNYMILAGPSIFGLHEVGRNTAYSIGLLTGIVLLSKPNLDRSVYISAIGKIKDETCWAFDKAEASIEIEESKS